MFFSEGEEEILECLDAATGKRQWRSSYATTSAARYGAGPGPRSNPSIRNGRVFTLGAGGILHAVDLRSGKVIWKVDLSKQYRLLPTFFGQGGTPLPLDDKLIVPLGTENHESLVALDPATGMELWAAKHAWGSSYASPIPARIHGRDCILAFQGGMDEEPAGGLLVVDASNGNVLSATPHRARMFASVSVSSPVVFENRVFVSEAYTEGGLCIEISQDFKARTVWRAPKFDTYLTTAVMADGCLFGFAGQHQQNAELVCVDASTGSELWRDDLKGVYQRGSLVKADGAFLCLGENGDLAWLDLTRRGARIVAAAKLFHAPESWTPPVISGGRLYICQNQPGTTGSKPRLLCYDIRAQ